MDIKLETHYGLNNGTCAFGEAQYIEQDGGRVYIVKPHFEVELTKEQYDVRVNQPDAAHDFDEKKWKWVLNPKKKAEIEAAEYAASIPAVVSMAQAQIALLKAGFLDDIEAAMTSDDMPREAKIYWQKSSVVERSNPIVNQMRDMLGLTDKDIDELFKQAASL